MRHEEWWCWRLHFARWRISGLWYVPLISFCELNGRAWLPLQPGVEEAEREDVDCLERLKAFFQLILLHEVAEISGHALCRSLVQ